jgi:hypothetical protein
MGFYPVQWYYNKTNHNKLRGLGPRANYTDRATATLMPTMGIEECHLVSVTDPYGRIRAFLDRSCYFFFQLATQWYSRG